jgi:hypothetical protein
MKELYHHFEKIGKRKKILCFCPVRIHGSTKSAAMKELVGRLGGSENPAEVPWECRTDPSLSARGGVEVCR